MAIAFPAAIIEDYEPLIPVMTNHAKDRHVLAAAVRANIGLIVTENVKDFPESACAPYGIEIQTADEFLSYALDQDPPGVIGAVRTMATKRRHPPTTSSELLTALATNLPIFTVEATPLLGSIEPDRC